MVYKNYSMLSLQYQEKQHQECGNQHCVYNGNSLVSCLLMLVLWKQLGVERIIGNPIHKTNCLCSANQKEIHLQRLNFVQELLEKQSLKWDFHQFSFRITLENFQELTFFWFLSKYQKQRGKQFCKASQKTILEALK